VPAWADILRLARRVASEVGLGYVGVDVVVDERDGPLLLEANARPGLAIQIANGQGLLPQLEAIDARLEKAAAPAIAARDRPLQPVRRAA
jgi:glutathione synthase/RimK-type ligase-like ATP-grasp enzyme